MKHPSLALKLFCGLLLTLALSACGMIKPEATPTPSATFTPRPAHPHPHAHQHPHHHPDPHADRYPHPHARDPIRDQRRVGRNPGPGQRHPRSDGG